jgi:hypothetical protein
MFLHLGNDIYIPIKSIVAICNLDTASVSKSTQIYLKKCEEKGIIETICEDIPKSFIVTNKKNKDKIYLTNISSTTLMKRAGIYPEI